MIILGVDPGDTETAWSAYDTDTKAVLSFAKEPNAEVLLRISLAGNSAVPGGFGVQVDKLAIEMIASYGMAVGKNVFETCVWIGRFIQQWDTFNCAFEREVIYRKDEKMHLCGTMRAKDSNIRQAIMDRYGSTRQQVLGTKKNPGPLYGVSKDVWAAIAVCITSAEMERK